MKSERHKNNSRIGGEQAVTLSSFSFVSCGNGIQLAGKAGTSQSQQQAVLTIPLPPHDNATPRSQPSLEGHVTSYNIVSSFTFCADV